MAVMALSNKLYQGWKFNLQFKMLIFFKLEIMLTLTFFF